MTNAMETTLNGMTKRRWKMFQLVDNSKNKARCDSQKKHVRKVRKTGRKDREKTVHMFRTSSIFWWFNCINHVQLYVSVYVCVTERERGGLGEGERAIKLVH